jgi:hypothetical protein
VAFPKSPIEGVAYLVLFTAACFPILLPEIHTAELVPRPRGRAAGTGSLNGFGEVKRTCPGLMNVPSPWGEAGAVHSLAEVLHQHQVRARPGANAKKDQALVRGHR